MKANDIEIILGSLDGIKRAEAPPFLYGKFQTKLSSPKNSILDRTEHFITRPVISVSIMFLILLMDGIVFRSTFNHMSDPSGKSADGISIKDNFDEMMFPGTPDNEYASIY